MNPRNLLVTLLSASLLVLSLAVPAAAQAHSGHDPAKKCVWQADSAPQFLPGHSSVSDSGTTTRTSIVFGTLVGKTAWQVVVLPGYHFGWVYAWDEGIPLASHCAKAYARASVYGVYKTVDCCQPKRSATPTMAVLFRVVAAQLNDPGTAKAVGMTHVYARNSKLACVATGAATTDSNSSGTQVTFQVPLPGGANAKVTTNLDFDSEEESVDESTSVSAGAAVAAPDEEYFISTDLDLMADADGAPWDTGEASATLDRHCVFISTVAECKHCLQKVRDQLLISGK